jgi:hypothetical protein
MVRRQRPDQLEKARAQASIGDFVKGVDQPDRFAPAQWVRVEACGGFLGEKIRHRDIKRAAHQIQPAGANPTDGALVFLHLLERDPNCGGEAPLAHAEIGAALLYARADLKVDRMRFVARSAVNCTLFRPDTGISRRTWG